MDGDSQVTAPASLARRRCPACEHCHTLGKGWGHPTAAAARRCRILPRLLSAGSPGPCLAPAHSQASSCTHLLPCHNLSAGPADQGCERSSSLRQCRLPLCPPGGTRAQIPAPKAAGPIAAISCCLGLRMNSHGGKGGTSPWGQWLPRCSGEHLQFQNLGLGHPVGAVIGKATSRAPGFMGPCPQYTSPIPGLSYLWLLSVCCRARASQDLDPEVLSDALRVLRGCSCCQRDRSRQAGRLQDMLVAPAMGSCDSISLVPLSRLLRTSPLSTNLSPSPPAPARSLVELRPMHARSAVPEAALPGCCTGLGTSLVVLCLGCS